MREWLFADPPDTLALTLRQVLAGRPILFVEHDENGGWHFFDGRQMFTGEELIFVPLRVVVERDINLDQLHDLPRGWRAWRDNPEEGWKRESRQSKDESRARAAEALAEMRRTSSKLPPGSPSTVELLREDRGR